MDIRAQHGFSLVELMISLVLSSVVMVNMYGTFVQHQRSATRQEHVTEVRQTVRLTMDAMLSELRGAGFDPDGSAKAGLVAADSRRIRFTRDMNCNGTIADVNAAIPAQGVRDRTDEDLAYSYNAATQTLARTVHANGAPTGGAQPVASHMLNVSFCYFVSTNPDTCVPDPAVLSDIRAVQITLTGRAAASDPQYSDPDPQGNPAYRHYHKATLTSLVQMRNLGVNRGGPQTSPVFFHSPCAL